MADAVADSADGSVNAAPGPEHAPAAGRRRDASPDRAFSAASNAFRRRAVVGIALTALLLAAISVAVALGQYHSAKSSAVVDLEARAVAVGAVVDEAFNGDIQVLETAARAPAVVNDRVSEMHAYFARIDAVKDVAFTNGLAWIDRQGRVVVSKNLSAARTAAISVTGREYFRQVMATGVPYVSAGLIGKLTNQPLVVVAVPTLDAAGARSGVLVGSIALKTGGSSSQAVALGFSGLQVIDRSGNLLGHGLKPVANRALLARMRKMGTGVIDSGPGLAGSGDDVVAFAGSPVTGWLVVIDRSQASVFAPAEHALLLELGSVIGALIVVGVIVAFLVRRARRDEEAQTTRARAWARLTRTLAAASTPSQVSDALLAALVDVFPDALTVVAFKGDDGLRGQASSRTTAVSLVVDDATLDRIAAVGRDHPSTVLLDADAALAGVLASFGRRFRALHAVPIGDRDDPTLGTISLLSMATGLAATDWSLLESFADQAAAALKRARVFEHEHDLATRLQRNLLPDRLPTSEGVGLSGHYHAGGAAVEVGGDWYDAVRRPDGIVQLCVGDVSGKGIGAATVMGRHRNTFHAYAYECTSPGEIIRKMLRHVHGDLMITVACVSVDPYSAEVSYSCAGHPPPLLVDRATHEVRRLDEASAPPLGVAEPAEIAERSITLDGPSTLALYTDGLIERRGRNIDQAIDFLGALIAADGAITPASVLDQITTAIGHPVDDVALLIAAIDDPASFDVELPATPAVLPGLRRRLRLWLQRRDLAREVLAEVVLAVSEACNNAIEHAYGGAGGTLRVRVLAADGLLRATIEDEGAWRDAAPGNDRGRGILLMRSLMDSAEIETSAAGTRVRLERWWAVETPPPVVSALA